MEATELLAGPQRHSLLVGGARSSKTTIITRGLAMRAMRGQKSGMGGRHVVLRHRFNAVKTSVWLDTWPKVLSLFFRSKEGLDVVRVDPHKQDGYIELWADHDRPPAEIWFAGLDDQERVDKILGKEFATIFFNEVSQIAYSSVIVALTRLAQVVKGEDADGNWIELLQRAWYDLNPVGKGHWTYKLFVEHVDPESGAKLADPENYAGMYLNPLDNAENLSLEYLLSLMRLPEKQRKRFFKGEYVAELDNALWTLEGIENCRVVEEEMSPMKRCLVSLDPSGCSGPEDTRSDAVGIVVGCTGMDKHGYILADETGWFSPEQWATKALDLRDKYDADAIVGEVNYGGDMVRAVIQAKDRNAKVIQVHASRGKHIRAEPISALYDQGRVHHVGRFERLEEEMTNFTTAGYEGLKSPNRADALVWLLTELMLDRPSSMRTTSMRAY